MPTLHFLRLHRASQAEALARLLQRYPRGLLWGRLMNNHGFESVVVPLVVALGLSVLGVLIAVLVGLAWN